MKDQTLVFLQAIYFDATTTLRHYDSTKTSFGQMFVALLSFLSALAVAGTTTGLAPDLLLPIALFTSLLSIVAMLMIVRFGRLVDFQRARANAAMAEYQRLVQDANLSEINAEAKRRVGRRPRIRLQDLWIAMFGLLAFANAAVLAIVLS